MTSAVNSTTERLSISLWFTWPLRIELLEAAQPVLSTVAHADIRGLDTAVLESVCAPAAV
jgi:hypothetical protein